MARTRRLTVAQALVGFLVNQYSERDGVEQRLIQGCFGIFGHGNVAGLGEALLESARRDPTAAVLRSHATSRRWCTRLPGFARMKNRLATLACTTSIGPGATNMVTGAALATINRLPVLLLPGDIFATRVASPVLQELEDARSYDISVNDCFKPVSRFWDRVNRPEQLPSSLLAAMRVLTDPVETGAVTLALPQDVQAEAWDWPEELFERRVWHVRRPPPEPGALAEAVTLVRGALRPLIVAGGGVIYSEATDALRSFAERTGIPVCETQAGKGSLPYDHPSSLGAVGATGSAAANAVARDADVVIGIGTRWSDFTTASRLALRRSRRPLCQPQRVAAGCEQARRAGLVADARAGIEGLAAALADWSVGDDYRERAHQLARAWDDQVEAAYTLGHEPLPSQSEVIGAVNRASEPRDVVVCAAGACPATCTSSGAPATRRATTSSTATRAWATRSPAGSASSWPHPTARSSSWSATART